MNTRDIRAEEIELRRESLSSAGAMELIPLLNAEMLKLYPEVGTPTHFRLDADEVADGRGAFLVAYSVKDSLGCGAIRRLDVDTAEIKRMYVKPSVRRMGLARRLLRALEEEARVLRVREIVLETGTLQPEAIALYSSSGYSKIKAFGEYAEHPMSVFMGKSL